MSNIKDLPGAGHDFRVTAGAGNFTKKFTSATRFGNLRNLQDNKATILKLIKKSEGVIRIGKFNRLRQLSTWRAIKKEEGNKLTKDDKKEIKAVLKHLGSRKEKIVVENKINRSQMQIARDDSFEKDRALTRQGRINRFDRSGNGGEAKLNFISQPNNAGHENSSMSGQILQRRFNTREKIIDSKLPSNRIGSESGPVMPPPAITREGEPHLPGAPALGMGKNGGSSSTFQNL